ncbi:poly-gamma-glutamate synthase PgsB [Bremerella sp. JC770]|uniref:poly-gamma-glutamate synthase PgsB n=1 Tax=Bremerella sp. JC770 TaxID=3232137 RepID=UPI003457E643
MATIVLLITTGLLIGYGIWELYRHRQKLAKIPIRVHVNGTRGKSSVARLIAAGLRASGMRTCCKTTGTLPRMIVPSGTEYPVFRPSKANVIEQVRIVDMAVEFEAEALVIECMALRPNLQWLCENKLVRATHGVITNAREDHLDVMGPTEKDVAWALAGMVPVKTKLFTAERDHLDVFAHASQDRSTELIAITEEDVEQITPLDLAGFMYVEHAENVALALRVCSDLGVDRATALRGMWEAKPDPGAMTAHEMDFFGRKIHFVNGFAANDPESTERIWTMALERYPEVERRVLVVNCRQDRPDRSQQLGKSVTQWPAADYYVLIGTGTYIFAKTATDAGIDPLKLVFAEDLPAPDIFETLLEYSGKTSLIMGIANIGGVGLDVVRYFANRSTQKTFK